MGPFPQLLLDYNISAASLLFSWHPVDPFLSINSPVPSSPGPIFHPITRDLSPPTSTHEKKEFSWVFIEYRQDPSVNNGTSTHCCNKEILHPHWGEEKYSRRLGDRLMTFPTFFNTAQGDRLGTYPTLQRVIDKNLPNCTQGDRDIPTYPLVSLVQRQLMKSSKKIKKEKNMK
jgi:hypothetical protein